MRYIRTAIAYLAEGVYTIVSIVKGLWVTLKNLFRKKVTMQYPEVRHELPPGYRGFPGLPVNPATGRDYCIGCGACMRACPTQVILVEAHMDENKKRVVDKFEINGDLCMFCGLCVDSCPVHAIVLTDTYEMASFSHEDMQFDRERLNKLGGERAPEKEPAPDEEAA